MTPAGRIFVEKNLTSFSTQFARPCLSDGGSHIGQTTKKYN